MIGKEYFVRQAMALLRLAHSVSDPDLSAKLGSKTADIEARLEETPPQQPATKTDGRRPHRPF